MDIVRVGRASSAFERLAESGALPRCVAIGCDSPGAPLWAKFETDPTADQMAAVESILIAANVPNMDDARAERDRRLAACDWTQIADAPLTDAQKELWRAYRQTLRDIPQIYTDPAAIVWPNPPEA